MIKLSKLTDYGIVLLTYIARDRQRVLHTARDLAEQAQVPLPTVSKVLKLLLAADLLESHRGVKGGYSLSRAPEEITVAEIISALEGPFGMTECTVEHTGRTRQPRSSACDLQPHCPVSRKWWVISHAVRDALERVTLADLVSPGPLVTGKARLQNMVPLSVVTGPAQ